jgi:hypothetical protein
MIINDEMGRTWNRRMNMSDEMGRTWNSRMIMSDKMERRGTGDDYER